MLIQVDERKIKTIEDITLFLAGADTAELRIQGSKDDIYSWVERTLNRLRYSKLRKKEKGLVLRYLIQLSGYSRQQVTRFILWNARVKSCRLNTLTGAHEVALSAWLMN
jgi:hypothetical protein